MRAKQQFYYNLIAYIFMIASNTIAITFNLNGYSVKQISDMYQNSITPAGFTFSIWTIIYIGLILCIFYMYREGKGLSALIAFPLMITSIVNGIWIFTWQYKLIFISFLLTMILCITLAILFLRIQTYKRTDTNPKLTYFVSVPLSIYFAWSLVAWIQNTAVLFVSLGFNGFQISQTIWALVTCISITIFTLFLIHTYKACSFSLTIIFAFFGIYANTSNSTIANVLLGCMLLLSIQIIYLNSRRYKHDTSKRSYI